MLSDFSDNMFSDSLAYLKYFYSMNFSMISAIPE